MRYGKWDILPTLLFGLCLSNASLAFQGELVSQFVAISEAMWNRQPASPNEAGKVLGGAGASTPQMLQADYVQVPALSASRSAAPGSSSGDRDSGAGGGPPSSLAPGDMKNIASAPGAKPLSASDIESDGAFRGGLPSAPTATAGTASTAGQGDDGEDMDISDNEDGGLAAAPSITGVASGDVSALAVSTDPEGTAGADADVSQMAAATRRRNFGAGKFGSGRVRRLGALGVSTGSGSAPSSASTLPSSGGAPDDTEGPTTAAPLPSASTQVGSSLALELSSWLRLGMLLPLLPTVHADRETDPQKSLKGQLIPALARIILSLPSSDSPSDVGVTLLGSGQHSSRRHQGGSGGGSRPLKLEVLHLQQDLGGYVDVDDRMLIEAAVGHAGETLQERLVVVLATLLAGEV